MLNPLGLLRRPQSEWLVVFERLFQCDQSLFGGEIVNYLSQDNSWLLCLLAFNFCSCPVQHSYVDDIISQSEGTSGQFNHRISATLSAAACVQTHPNSRNASTESYLCLYGSYCFLGHSSLYLYWVFLSCSSKYTSYFINLGLGLELKILSSNGLNTAIFSHSHVHDVKWKPLD